MRHINALYDIFRSLNTFISGYDINVYTSSSQTAVFGWGRSYLALLLSLASYQTSRFHNVSPICCLFIRYSLCYVALVIYVEFVLLLFLSCCLAISGSVLMCYNGCNRPFCVFKYSDY